MARRRRAWTWLAAFGAAVLAYVLLWPVPIEPQAWDPPPAPPLEGVLAPNDALADADLVGKGLGIGPESIAFGPDGWLYTGVEDGRILRFRVERPEHVETFTETDGRPLGLRFDDRGHLWVADARRGLLRVTPDGSVEVIVDAFDGEPVVFADDLDIASDGTVWFSEASRYFSVEQSVLDALDGRATGRLFSHDPSTGDTRVHLSQLRFANGVALAPDETYVLVNETFGYRITRLWLQGPRAGQTDRFVEHLPGFPDNCRFGPDGLLWVALVKPRSAMLDAISPHPALRRMVARLPSLLVPEPAPLGWVVALDTRGRVAESLQDSTGRVHDVTCVTPKGDALYLGSLHMDAVARFDFLNQPIR